MDKALIIGAAIDRQIGSSRFQTEFLSQLNKLEYNLTLEDVMKAFNRAQDSTVAHIKSWEAIRIAQLEQSLEHAKEKAA